jgi:hypothetical protein
MKGGALKKTNSTQQQWERLWDDAQKVVSKMESDDLAQTAIKVISNEKSKGAKLAVSYSGGKDGMVAYHLAQICGVSDGVTSLTLLDYPFWREHILRTAPKGVEVKDLQHLNFNWVNSHLEFCIPIKYSLIPKFWGMSHWSVQNTYFKSNGIDLLITGRRVSDGNYCGRKGEYIVMNSDKNVLNPIRDWSHHQTFAFMQYNGIELPEWYHKPFGWVDGPITAIEENSVNVSKVKNGIGALRHRTHALERIYLKCERTGAVMERIMKANQLL